MAKTVMRAFEEFMKNSVNLDPTRTEIARKSRDFLVEQILGFPTKDDDFLDIYKDKNEFFGSFARKTKKRPLDDIDIMIALQAQGCTYLDYGDRVEIKVDPNSPRQYKQVCNNNSDIVNSRKILNLFLKSLKNVHQYKNAALEKNILRNREAIVLRLTSYEWNFDIVPCFFTAQDYFGKDYYLIPDANGNWQKTDPRLDRDRVKNINQKHKGRVLNVIRAIKYWNKRPTMPTMSSYLLENITLDYYDSLNAEETTNYVDIEISNLFKEIGSKIFYPVYDPKNIQGDLNNLTLEEKRKISYRANLDNIKAKEAIKLERETNHEKSIQKWREVFGNEFPEYE